MPRKSSFVVPLDMLALDRNAGAPLYRQLYGSLRRHILDGRLAARMRLPATRELARELNVSRNTVIAAYDTLTAEGYLESVAGSGTRVANLPEPPTHNGQRSSNPRLPRLSARGILMTDRAMDRTIPNEAAFHPGYPEIKQFPFATWAKLLTANSRHSGEDLFGYSDTSGHPRLRTAIAEYLNISRGVKCTAEQVVVVTGAQAGLDLIGRIFMDPGDAFWIEEPGYSGALLAFQGSGGRPIPLQVGSDGWRLDTKPRPPPRLIFVTPSCQWPLGSVMQLEARLRLLQLAEKYDAWIVEDDYDSEYRFRGHPIPAMQGLDESGRVIYVGTFSKTMFPALRVGYLVVPLKVVERFKAALSATGQYPPLVLQAALADFVGQGFFLAHLRRMRRLYRIRQQNFLAMCQDRLDRWLTVSEADTGMQVVGRFRRPMEDGDVLAAAIHHGVNFIRLSAQYHHSPPEQGAFLGYAGVKEDQMRVGIERLRKAFEDVERHS